MTFLHLLIHQFDFDFSRPRNSRDRANPHGIIAYLLPRRRVVPPKKCGFAPAAIVLGIRCCNALPSCRSSPREGERRTRRADRCQNVVTSPQGSSWRCPCGRDIAKLGRDADPFMLHLYSALAEKGAETDMGGHQGCLCALVARSWRPDRQGKGNHPSNLREHVEIFCKFTFKPKPKCHSEASREESKRHCNCRTDRRATKGD